jgi:hypothetical protein
LKEQDIIEFADLWEQEFGEKLSADESHHQAYLLLELYVLVYRSPAEAQQIGGPEPAAHFS